MQTFQSASPRRVFVELTPSRTNSLQLSFVKRRRTSNSSAETFSQEELSCEKQMKRVKEGDVNVQCPDTKSIPCCDIDIFPIHASHGTKVKNLEPNAFSKDGRADICVDCVSKNEVLYVLVNCDLTLSKLLRNIIRFKVPIPMHYLLIIDCSDHFFYQKSKSKSMRMF